jgi:hypothetical protein
MESLLDELAVLRDLWSNTSSLSGLKNELQGEVSRRIR